MTIVTLTNRLLRLSAPRLCGLAALLGVAYRDVTETASRTALKVRLAAKITSICEIYYAKPDVLGGTAFPSVAFTLTHGHRQPGDVPVLRAPSARFCYAIGGT